MSLNKNFTTNKTIPQVDIHLKAIIKLNSLNKSQKESQVIVHCTYTPLLQGEQIRICKSTYLKPHEEVDNIRKLQQVYNISIYPDWTLLEPNNPISFTLVFAGLPTDCKSFDLIEEVFSSIPIEIKDIKRNETDVYNVVIPHEFL